MMKKSYLAILALAALPPTIAAASQFHHTPGAMCLPGYNPETAVARGPNLINWQTSGLTFACPIPFTSTTVSPVTVDPSTARIDYYDGSASGDVTCHLAIVTNTGTTVWSSLLYSCATPGGCSGGTGYVGAGFLTIPDTIASTASVVGMSVSCALPGYDSVNGVSSISGVAASTVTP